MRIENTVFSWISFAKLMKFTLSFIWIQSDVCVSNNIFLYFEMIDKRTSFLLYKCLLFSIIILIRYYFVKLYKIYVK